MFRKIKRYILKKLTKRTTEGIDFGSSHVDLIGVYETDGKELMLVRTTIYCIILLLYYILLLCQGLIRDWVGISEN